jgi:HEAT repeat protein
MVLGLFSKKSSLDRAIKKATSPNSQSADRVASMEALAQDGGHDALLALCKRFSFSASKMIEDEQEKQLAVEMLSAQGEAAVEPLHDYMKSAKTIAFPLRILERVAEAARRFEVVDDLLEREEPGYTKDTTRRIQLIEWLGELEDVEHAEVAKRVAPYFEDFDENVRIAAAEALALKPCAEAAQPLVDALLREGEESFRLRRRLAEILADNDLSLCGRKSEVAALTENQLSDFRLHRDKLARKK